jgi:hypothetical protein
MSHYDDSEEAATQELYNITITLASVLAVALLYYGYLAFSMLTAGIGLLLWAIVHSV